MFAMKVSPNSDGHFPELEGKTVITHDTGITVARVRGAKSPDAVSIVVPLAEGTKIAVSLTDGTTVDVPLDGVALHVKTSLRLFLAATESLRGAAEDDAVKAALQVRA